MNALWSENPVRKAISADRLRAMLRSTVSRRRLTTFVAADDAAHLERLADLVETGHVTPVVDQRFSLSRAADAMRHRESGRVRGKLVVEM